MHGWRLSLVLIGIVGCASGSEMGGAGGSAGAGTGAGNFAGTYAATLSETVTLDGAGSGPFTASATITLSGGTSTDMLEKITDGTSTCMFTYDRDGDSASAMPANQSCSYVLSNGNHQTNTNSTHRATINGNTLTIDIAGTYVGTTSHGIHYSGSFTGAWTGTRQ